MNRRKALSADQAARYFETRLGELKPNGSSLMALCPFHPDRNPSLAVRLDEAHWYCHACRFGGGPVEMELRLARQRGETRTDAQAAAEVAELVGAPKLSLEGGLEAVYQYLGADGKLVHEVLRYRNPDGSKRIVQRRPDGNGFAYNLNGVRRVLYRLPEVIIANQVFICEGEKDCDRVASLGLGQKPGVHFAATTNSGGAGKWAPEFSPFLAGKQVAILADNDEPGRRHAEQVAVSVTPFAAGVKIVALPGLPEKGDVSDYLDSHTADDLLGEVARAPRWKPPVAVSYREELLVPAQDFMAASPEAVDWLVEGVIQRGANGVIAANPKCGKSWAAVDMALSLALGEPWLGFCVPRASRVALVSREDNPALTGWRMRHLLAGRAVNPEELAANLHVNSRQQSRQLMLDNPEQMSELLTALRKLRPEFLILDVLNILHSADENDQGQMRALLNTITEVQGEIGCSVCLVHHFNKASAVEASLTQRLRGSSAIAGWVEWMIGLSIADPESKVRRMEFELKAAAPPDPVYFRIETDDGRARLEVERSFQARSPRAHRGAADILSGRPS